MKSIRKYRSFITILSIILLCLLFLTRCINNGTDTVNKSAGKRRYTQYAGTASCINCHKSICDSFSATAHFHSSEIASEKNIKGSFAEGENKYTYSSGAFMLMQKQDSGFYQVGFIKDIERKKQRFDIVVGVGTQAQSYMSWLKKSLMQLPITYFTSAHQWSNSPGYPDKIAFDRPITSRCLECHSSYAEVISAPEKEPEEYDKSRMILGVNCEKCHGPAAEHVKFQTENPTVKTAKFILNPSKFSRQQSLDMCAVCHGGGLEKSKPSFQFTPGDKLADYFLIDSTPKDVNTLDVHGNQYGLLKASKCFMNSQTLTCNTCHNTHQNEVGKATIYAQRCNNCHADKHTDKICKMTASLSNKSLNENCVNCHMPQQSSMAIAVILQGKPYPTPALMHTHLIRTYPDETKKILALIKDKKIIKT